MIKIAINIGCFLEYAEKNFPKSFWTSIILLWFFFTHEPEPIFNKFHIVIEQIRDGSNKKYLDNFDKDKHKFLSKTVPDSERRVALEKTTQSV